MPMIYFCTCDKIQTVKSVNDTTHNQNACVFRSSCHSMHTVLAAVLTGQCHMLPYRHI